MSQSSNLTHEVSRSSRNIVRVTESIKAELSKVPFDRTIEEMQTELYANVRIPTACMNFISTILGLTADQFKAPTFQAVLKAVKKSDFANWNAQCKELQDSIGAADRYLPSHHWYQLTSS